MQDIEISAENMTIIRDMSTVLWHLAAAMADFLEAVGEKRPSEAYSNYRFMKKGVEILTEDYINEFGDDVVSIRGFVRTTASPAEEFCYREMLTSYLYYRHFVEVVEQLVQEYEGKTQGEADKTILQKMKNAYSQFTSKRVLKKERQDLKAREEFFGALMNLENIEAENQDS